MRKIPDRGERSERAMHVEFTYAKEKKDFQDKCYGEGRTPAKVIKILANMYTEGKIKLE